MILVWLPVATATRFAQLDYIAQRNAKAAIEIDERIEKQTDLLIAHPEIGRPGRKKGTRELVISRTPFIVVYRVKSRAARIELLRVLHTNKNAIRLIDFLLKLPEPLLHGPFPMKNFRYLNFPAADPHQPSLDG